MSAANAVREELRGFMADVRANPCLPAPSQEYGFSLTWASIPQARPGDEDRSVMVEGERQPLPMQNLLDEFEMAEAEGETVARPTAAPAPEYVRALVVVTEYETVPLTRAMVDALAMFIPRLPGVPLFADLTVGLANGSSQPDGPVTHLEVTYIVMPTKVRGIESSATLRETITARGMVERRQYTTASRPTGWPP